MTIRLPTPTDKTRADFLVAKLARMMSRLADGTVTVPLNGQDDTCWAMLAELLPHDRIPVRRRFDMLREATIANIRSDSLTLESLLAAYDTRTKTYLAKPEVRYVLASSLSVRYDRALLPRLRIGDTTFTFSWTHPRRYRSPTGLREDMEGREDQRVPLGFTAVRVGVQARDAATAADTAFERLDLLRGIWNFFRTYGRYRITFGRGRPINPFMLGPIQTLHDSDGSPAVDSYWTSTADAPSSASLGSDLRDVYAFERQVRTAIRDSPVRHHIERCLIRYCRALDEAGPDAAYLKLWSVLEELTVTRKNDTHQITVKRGSVLFKNDREFQRLQLGYLRDRRNQLVHEGAELAEYGELVSQLKVYVEALLSFTLKHASAFRSVAELGEFLDVMNDQSRIARDIELRRYALELPTAARVTLRADKPRV